MRETYLTSREQDYLKLEEELKQDEQKITKFNFTDESTIFLPDETELKLEKVDGKYKPIDFDWYLSPEEITNKILWNRNMVELGLTTNSLKIKNTNTLLLSLRL